ncbi:hypothetical protein VST63_10820 [Mycolicibacterium sp. 050232]|uniref:hypothetical protein n=1 Tax=Mycolicibacterium sp. 050232 TaxID=3113982 RepID=UPI002E2B962B|nr:hypothetical protein [Mycolicibacterium sp. 050232]MED5812853.1 hypothetical protein [Mycolicibacterium sp. 050232]
MTNFGGDNPIGGRGPQPPHGVPNPGRPSSPAPGSYPPGPAGGGFPGAGFGAPPSNQPPFSGSAFPNPAGNAPFPGGAPMYGAPGFSPPTYGSPSPKSRHKLAVIVGAVVAVVAVVVGIVVFVGNSGPDAKTASGAVEGYLKALANGDADKALSFGIDEPPDKTYVTDAVLKKQIEKMPITDIKILGEDSDTVHVVANFGDQPIDQEIPVKQSGDGTFKVEYTTYPLNFGKDTAQESTAALDWVTIFGEKLPSSGIAYLFPGAIEVGSSNPNITLEYRRDAYLDPAGNYPILEETADFELKISDEGHEAADKAILDVMTECAKSTTVSTPGCPTQNIYLDGFIEGTARWSPPTSTNGVVVKLPPLNVRMGMGLSGRADVDGYLEMRLSAQSSLPDGNADNENVQVDMDGYVDFTENPPTYTYEKD